MQNVMNGSIEEFNDTFDLLTMQQVVVLLFSVTQEMCISIYVIFAKCAIAIIKIASKFTNIWFTDP